MANKRLSPSGRAKLARGIARRGPFSALMNLGMESTKAAMRRSPNTKMGEVIPDTESQNAELLDTMDAYTMWKESQ